MGIRALFINKPDNVPFERYYRTQRGFTIGLRNIKHAQFKWAIDEDNVRILYPEDVRRRMYA